MATKIITKHSNSAKDPQPDDIERAELAIDLERRKIFTKDNSDQVVELGGSPDADNYGHWKLQVDYGQPYEVVSGATANFEGTNGIKVTRTGDTVTIDGSELDLDEEADNYQYWQYKVDGFSTTNVLSTQFLDFQSGDGIDITKEGYGIKISATGGGSGGGVTLSATEPTDKTEGMMWMDTSASPALVWIWDGAAWVEFPFVGGGSDGSGGGSGPKLPELQYLLIGGGGNGGYVHQGTYAVNDTRGCPGGGGAGGYRTNVPGDRSGGNTDPEVTPPELLNIPAYSQFRILVGEGGEARSGADWATMGQNGKPSAIQDVDGNPILQSEGGGAGSIVWAGTAATCPPSLFAGDGGSGGGGAGGSTNFALQDDRNGKGISGQGFDGGNRGAGANGNIAGGGAGGGAGGPAFPPDGTNSRDGMNGGPGLVSSIDGLNKERAGGGAGVSARTHGAATHGGGQPARATNDTADSICNGEPHTGAGAGSYFCTTTGSTAASTKTNAPGGSGLVVIRYFGPQVCFGGEVTTHNGYTVHTFKSDGIFTVGSLT